MNEFFKNPSAEGLPPTPRLEVPNETFPQLDVAIETSPNPEIDIHYLDSPMIPGMDVEDRYTGSPFDYDTGSERELPIARETIEDVGEEMGSGKVFPDLDLNIQNLDSPMTFCIKETGSGDADDSSPREIKCRNEHLEGSVHPETGVPFERKTIEVNGERTEGVFPQFESEHTVCLPEELHEASDREQFAYANEKLKEAVENDPELREKFSDEQLEQIANGDRPDGYVWHHAENPGELQLVERDTHDKTGHTGGKVVWGGGSENR